MGGGIPDLVFGKVGGEEMVSCVAARSVFANHVSILEDWSVTDLSIICQNVLCCAGYRRRKASPESEKARLDREMEIFAATRDGRDVEAVKEEHRRQREEQKKSALDSEMVRRLLDVDVKRMPRLYVGLCCSALFRNTDGCKMASFFFFFFSFFLRLPQCRAPTLPKMISRLRKRIRITKQLLILQKPTEL